MPPPPHRGGLLLGGVYHDSEPPEFHLLFRHTDRNSILQRNRNIIDAPIENTNEQPLNIYLSVLRKPHEVGAATGVPSFPGTYFKIDFLLLLRKQNESHTITKRQGERGEGSGGWGPRHKYVCPGPRENSCNSMRFLPIHI